jgi:hypothetical protein
MIFTLKMKNYPSHQLKLRLFVIFWSYVILPGWTSNVLFLLLRCNKAKQRRTIGRNHVNTKIHQVV